MQFLEVIKNDITNLPIEPIVNLSFRQQLKSLMENFGEIIDNSDNLSDAINDIPFNHDIFKKRNKALRDSLTKAVDAYYEGNPSNAYLILSDGLKKSNLKGYLKDLRLTANTNFYRIRVQNGNYPLPKNELFHIPFEKRGRVQTQRFSIPGLPSLYLSNSLYVAWEELMRPGFNEIQAVRLSNTRDLILLDLTSDLYNSNSHLLDNHAYGWQLLYKVMVWPLIAACSFKVRDKADTFKPEYIIPQLLLQWVNKNKIDGVQYSSTHIDPRQNKHFGRFYNVVVPVKTAKKEKGYCSGLRKLFKLTTVLPMQLRQFASHTDRLEGQPSISTNVNPDVILLELVKGNGQYYSSTYFGILEYSLLSLQLEYCD